MSDCSSLSSALGTVSAAAGALASVASNTALDLVMMAAGTVSSSASRAAIVAGSSAASAGSSSLEEGVQGQLPMSLFFWYHKEGSPPHLPLLDCLEQRVVIVSKGSEERVDKLRCILWRR